MKITEECIACGTCAEACPVEAIVALDDIYAITEVCSGCRACFDICPVDAIVD